MKRTFILPLVLLLICGLTNLNAQTDTDSTYEGSNALPPTSKSKQGDAATKYSVPPPSKQKSDWKKKIYLGGYFGASFGSYTNVEISPIIGYNFTRDFSMGVGVIYSYYAYDTNIPGAPKVSSSNWGFRMNANYVLLKFIRLGAEYQFLNVDRWTGNINPDGSLIYEKEPYNILFVGAGINQRFGGNASLFIMVYYDVLQNDYYNDNYIFRIGVAAGF